MRFACGRMPIYLNVTGILQISSRTEVMQICPRLTCKNECSFQAKRLTIAGRKTHKRRQLNPQLHTKEPAITCNLPSHRGLVQLQVADKLYCILQVKLPTTRVFYYLLLRDLFVSCFLRGGK